MAKILRDRFPIVYEAGEPQAVIVDVETFDRMVEALERLKQLADDPEEALWMLEVIKRARAYRKQHPDEDSPDAVRAALSDTEAE